MMYAMCTQGCQMSGDHEGGLVAGLGVSRAFSRAVYRSVIFWDHGSLFGFNVSDSKKAPDPVLALHVLRCSAVHVGRT